MQNTAGRGTTWPERWEQTFGRATEGWWSRLVLGPAVPPLRLVLRMVLLVTGWMSVAIALVDDLGMGATAMATNYALVAIVARIVPVDTRDDIVIELDEDPFSSLIDLTRSGVNGAVAEPTGEVQP